MTYVWYFLGYGFLGYLLEKAFARATHAAHQVRKGFVLMPVCPVYGLAMCLLLALRAAEIDSFWEQAFLGGAVCTGVEYAVHWGCEEILGVKFWDYSATKMDVNGRICLPFSAVWGLLSALSVRRVQPAMAALAALIPQAVTNVVLFVLALDALWSTGILLRWGDVELLAPAALRARRAKKVSVDAARSSARGRRTPTRGSPR